MRRFDGGNRGYDDDGDGGVSPSRTITSGGNYMDRGSGIKSNIFGIREP
jgi:hypothetical protein